MRGSIVDFPILPSDALDEDPGLDSEDVKEAVRDLLIRTGREFRPGILTAPMVTVEDLVRYLQASPRMEETWELVSRASWSSELRLLNYPFFPLNRPWGDSPFY
jgi:hypothetical protein